MPEFLTGLIIGFFIGVAVTTIVAIVAISDANKESVIASTEE